MNRIDPTAPPEGFRRGPKKGWLIPKSSPLRGHVTRLNNENEALQQRLSTLEATLQALVEKAGVVNGS